MEWTENTGFLQFDNLNFKLAVLQCLIYEKHLLSAEHGMGDFYELYEIEEESEWEDAIEAYTTGVRRYFEELEIPCFMGAEISCLNIEAGDDIYQEIYPDWGGEDNRFDVDEISFREAAQFKNLKEIRFWYMSQNEEGIAKMLKPLKIKVLLPQTGNVSSKKGRINPLISLVIMLAAALMAGAVLVWTSGRVELSAEIRAIQGAEKQDSQAAESEDIQDTEGVRDEEAAVDTGDMETAQPDSIQEINGIILEYSSKERGYSLKTKEGQPYHEGWFEFVEGVNSRYFYIAGRDGKKQLFDSSSQAFIDLSQYVYVSTILLRKDDKFLDEQGVWVTEDRKKWLLIRADYQTPTEVDVEGKDTEAVLAWIDLTSGTPIYVTMG